MTVQITETNDRESYRQSMIDAGYSEAHADAMAARAFPTPQELTRQRKTAALVKARAARANNRKR